VVIAAVAVSQLMILLVSVRKRIPVSILKALTHHERLASAPSPLHPSNDAVFWLPPESLCAGRITSKMARTASFFGPGRR
jgi:hypothetical protein